MHDDNVGWKTSSIDQGASIYIADDAHHHVTMFFEPTNRVKERGVYFRWRIHVGWVI
jgi:hypothetical protein